MICLTYLLIVAMEYFWMKNKPVDFQRLRRYRHNGYSGSVAMAQQAMVQIMASDSTTQQAKEKAAEAANKLMELRELIKERVDP